MLKLKDNIDLKELEKHGIVKDRYTYGVLGEITLYGEDFSGSVEMNGYKFIDYEDGYNLDVIYDLIKADLVEKW